MGIGHFVRSLTLARLLLERGARTRFISRAHKGHLIDSLRELNIMTAPLPAPEAAPARSAEDYGTWLGVSQEVDAAESVQALGDSRPDWLVVDHYGLDSAWEAALRPHAQRVLVIDDLANRPHDCDLLLDQGYSDSDDERYRKLVPCDCRQLLGPRYALLKPEYRHRRVHMGPRRPQLRRILVFFGGSDPANMTGTALETLTAPEFAHLTVDLVVGVNNRHRRAIESAARRRHDTIVHGPRPHLADLMADADLAIGAGGATTWERMCLGLPSIVVSTADNQSRSCEALAADGLIQYLGAAPATLGGRLREELLALMGRPDLLQQSAVRCARVVDGLGAARVCEIMVPTRREDLRVRAADPGDEQLYLDWANDPEVRRQSFHTEAIDCHSHQKWFSSKLRDRDSQLFVMLAGDLPVGQIRFDRLGQETVIDFSIDAQFRGRGWGQQLVRLGMREIMRQRPAVFRADVRESNILSGAVFRGLGFRESVVGNAAGFRTYRLEPANHSAMEPR
jgi:UDP-2,4-diacetamido-2,4,6-trideoxy-beta-L-altropyranose hydrolase